jgi:hypothetical protein
VIWVRRAKLTKAQVCLLVWIDHPRVYLSQVKLWQQDLGWDIRGNLLTWRELCRIYRSGRAVDKPSITVFY